MTKVAALLIVLALLRDVAPPLPPTPAPDKPVRPPTEGGGSTYVYLPIVGGGAG